jgi:CheY-like chemotaxis protein
VPAQEAELPSTVPLPVNDVKLTILIAEDNDYNYIVTHDTLLKYFPKSDFLRVHNGKEAIEAMDEDEYDIVLMDIQMPIMDGYDATKQIRINDQKTPIIGITASVLGTDIEQCLKAGMQAYIPKPFTENEFVHALNTVLNLPIAPIITPKNAERERQLFLEIIPVKIKSLQENIDAKAYKNIRDLAHTIRPQLVNNQLDVLASYCLDIQSSADEDSLAIAQQILQGLQHALNEKKK